METELIAWLRQHLPPHPSLKLGIGDDAAVLDLAGRPECVVTVDLLSDGVDFHSDQADPCRVGHKALAASLSDLAAMAARPLAAVVALALPRHGAMQLAQGIYAGMLPLAERYRMCIAGGDTNSWDNPLVVSVTAIGTLTPRGALRRCGARPGDRILVTGRLGGSILGRHLDVEPRVDEALLLHERYALNAGIDISDGLAIDLGRLTDESGCGAIIEAAAIPIAPAAIELAASGLPEDRPLGHALGDGEDFELLLALPPAEAQRMLADKPLDILLTDIGHFVAERGLWLQAPDGTRTPCQRRGYVHKFD